MNSRREYREIVKAKREGSTHRSLLPELPGALRLFIFLVLCSSSAFSQNIQNHNYDINDPRNPDCPCHKLQKLADEAYQNLLNNDQLNIRNPQQQFVHNNNIRKTNNIGNEQNQFLVNVRSNASENNGGNRGSDNSANQQKKDFNFAAVKKPVFSGSSGAKAKKKNPGSFVSKKLNRTRLKHSKIKKVRPNYAVCYKW